MPKQYLATALVCLTILSPLYVLAQTPTQRALLIGIDDYRSPAIADLRGCANDVELMRAILIGKFDFPPENIQVLKNERATRQGIIDAVQHHLIAKARPEDVVIIHYSGHGSQMPDNSGDEIDGLDETIVPHDSRTTVTGSDGQRRRVFDISDDELNGFLLQLTEKTNKVTFILDSCHSGSGTRAGNTVREIPPDTAEPPGPGEFAVSVRGADGDAGIRLRGADYVLISGCLSTQLSNEALLGGQRHGVLTYFLAEALRAAGADSTYQEVMDRVASDVNSRFPAQHPQLEGPGTDLPVFGAEHIRAEPYLVTRLSGFALHSDEDTALRAVARGNDGRRNLCIARTDSASECYAIIDDPQDATIDRALLSGAFSVRQDESVSVGQAFDQAYRIQDATGAKRVEPLLEVQMPGLENDRGAAARSIGEGERHAEQAEQDDHWSHKQIRAPEAWKKLRERHNVAEGAEADGVLIAHPDTGYRKHPETWHTGVNGKRPVDPSKGYDYFDQDEDPEDPLLNDRRLDNPAHGTTSGSVIVSPPGCQLAGEHGGCVDGVARGAQLVPLRIHRTVSQFNTERLAQAIRDVAESADADKPRLVSIAMGGPPSWTLWKAVKAAEASGVLIIAASGNYVRTVVWPARFDSTIAVAATNVYCRPWRHSSRGGSIDIAAPGESVWRAWVDETGTDVIAMSKGTTLATGNTSGAAALWLAYHRDDPALAALQQQGFVTAAFREALAASRWRPGVSNDPPGTHCDAQTPWDEDYGPGILDAAALLEHPLVAPAADALAVQTATTRGLGEEELPLYRTLYPKEPSATAIRRDYLSIFNYPLAGADRFETEILHHYTVDDEVRRAIDALVENQAEESVEPLAQRVRRALLEQDLSKRLRDVLNSA